MKKLLVNLHKGEGLDIHIPWDLLSILFAELVFLKKFVSGNKELDDMYFFVESVLRKQKQTIEEMKHIHTCRKCHMFIDDRKDRFYHNEHSDYEEWQHIPDCPELKEFK